MAIITYSMLYSSYLTNERQPYSRRQFLKDSLTAAGAVVLAPWLRLLGEPSIADRIAAMEPIKGWKVPDNEERQISLANPDFFTKPRGPSGNKIITAQFDENQYKRLKPQYLSHLKSADYKGNSCSEAVIATVLKTFAYFKTGDVPDISIADVINELMDVTHQGSNLIQPNYIAMQDNHMKWAIEFFGQKTGMFSAVPLTPDWGLNNTHVVTPSQWNPLLESAKIKVFDEGGFGIVRGLKWGKEPGTVAHFVIISNLNPDKKPLIIDSIGPKQLGDPVTALTLGSYFDRVRPQDAPAWAPYWANQPGLLWMGGVIPTSNSTKPVNHRGID